MYWIDASRLYDALGEDHCSQSVRPNAAAVVYRTPRSPPHHRAVRIETGYKKTPTCRVGVSHKSRMAMARSKITVSRLRHERGGRLNLSAKARICAGSPISSQAVDTRCMRERG